MESLYFVVNSKNHASKHLRERYSKRTDEISEAWRGAQPFDWGKARNNTKHKGIKCQARAKL